MSVLVIGKFKGDTAKFQQALVDRADEWPRPSARRTSSDAPLAWLPPPCRLKRHGGGTA
jgi:hypothetical protein